MVNHKRTKAEATSSSFMLHSEKCPLINGKTPITVFDISMQPASIRLLLKKAILASRVLYIIIHKERSQSQPAEILTNRDKAYINIFLGKLDFKNYLNFKL